MKSAPLPGGVERALYDDLLKGGSGLLKKVKRENQIILHNYEVAIKKRASCALKHCDKTFFISLIPGQIIYPKYCSEHRTPHRRTQHNKCF